MTSIFDEDSATKPYGATSATAPFPAEPEPEPWAAAQAAPRIRWAAIVWGTVFCAIALATMLIVGSPERREAFGTWLGTLQGGGFMLIAFLAVGCLILLLGILAAVRRAQVVRAEAARARRG